MCSFVISPNLSAYQCLASPNKALNNEHRYLQAKSQRCTLHLSHLVHPSSHSTLSRSIACRSGTVSCYPLPGSERQRYESPIWMRVCALIVTLSKRSLRGVDSPLCSRTGCLPSGQLHGFVTKPFPSASSSHQHSRPSKHLQSPQFSSESLSFFFCTPILCCSHITRQHTNAHST